jgi:sporulation protein YlmC with PRC-barrel domain
MMLASDIEGRPLAGAGGVVLGTVKHLLYHPDEPRVIGAIVRPPAALVVVARPETYLPLFVLRLRSDEASTDMKKLPTQRQAAESLGFDPDLTVIWTGMPVAGPSGEQVGTVSDVEFDPETGAVGRMEVAAGAIADAAHGRFLVPPDRVIGYAAGAVRIGVEAGALEATGGFAKAAARTVVTASVKAAAVGEVVGGVVVTASGAAGKAIKVVADSKVAEKTAKRVKGTWRDTVTAFRDGMKDDD